MTTIHPRKKSAIAAVGAAVAAAALPAFLFTGAGTAQAATTLNTTSDAVGVTVEIHSTGSLVWMDDCEALAGVQGSVLSAGEPRPQPLVPGHPDRDDMESESRMPRRRR